MEQTLTCNAAQLRSPGWSVPNAARSAGRHARLRADPAMKSQCARPALLRRSLQSTGRRPHAEPDTWLLHRFSCSRMGPRSLTTGGPVDGVPRCKSVMMTKDGTTQLGGQRFRCSQCGRRFTRRSSSAFSGRAFPDDIIALAVRWSVRYRLSYAEVSEWLAESGVLVDQSTIFRWVQRYPPLFG